MTASDVRTPTDRSGRGLTLQVSADYVLSHLGYFTVMPVLPILLAVQLADHGAQWVGIALFALAAAVRGGSLVVTRVIHRSTVRTTVVAGLLLAGGGFAASGWVAHPVAVIAALAVAGLGISVNALAMRAYIAVSTDDVARRNEMYSAIQVGRDPRRHRMRIRTGHAKAHDRPLIAAAPSTHCARPSRSPGRRPPLRSGW